MAVTSGFFDAVSGDRVYDATTFNSVFGMFVTDGVVEGLIVSGSGTANVKVTSGKAWVFDTWVINDADMNVAVANGPGAGTRTDAIVIDVDKRVAQRTVTIKVLNGPGGAVEPTYLNTSEQKQYPIALIARGTGNTTVSAGQVTNVVGKPSRLPYATSKLLPVGNASALTTKATPDNADWAVIWPPEDTPKKTSISGLRNRVLGFTDLPSSDHVVDSMTTDITTGQVAFLASVNYAPVHMSRRNFAATVLGSFRTRSQTWRGEGLGPFGSGQLNQIRGRIGDFWLGDYWLAPSGAKWRIMHFDYYKGTSGVDTTGRIIVVRDTVVPSAGTTKMNSTNTTTGGYNASAMYSYLASAPAFTQSEASSIFGAQGAAAYATRTFYGSTSVSASGIVSGRSPVTSFNKLSLLTETMLCGSRNLEAPPIGTDTGFSYAFYERFQLDGFRIRPEYISSNERFWLRDVASTTRFGHITTSGFLGATNASDDLYVRPFVEIG